FLLTPSLSLPLYFFPLSLHDALPISSHRHLFFRKLSRAFAHRGVQSSGDCLCPAIRETSPFQIPDQFTNFPRHQLRRETLRLTGDRKSTRLNSSHGSISYAVFCLKKK